MAKRHESPISYRPSDKVKKMFDQYCSHGAMLTKAQLIDISLEYLMMRPRKEMERIMWKLLTRQFDDGLLEEEMMDPSKE